MGNCFDNPNEDIIFQGFRNDLQDDEMNYEKVCLFGLSGSGKSTLYLNLRQLYDDADYDHKQQLKHCESIIRSNCLLYIAILINESQKLYTKTQNDLYYIDYNSKSTKDAIQLITKYIPYKFDKYTPPKPLPKPLPTITNPVLKPTIKPLPSLTAPSQPAILSNQLPVLEEKAELSNLEIGRNVSFESNHEEMKKLTMEQADMDSSAFMAKFNIDDSQQNKDDDFYGNKEHTLKDESKTNHNIMESDDQSYLTMDNIESNKIKVKNDIITLGEEDEHIEEKGLYLMQNEYIEELGYLISEYDDLGYFDEMGIEIHDIWNYQNNTNWKNKFNQRIMDKDLKRYQFEPYKPFDFEEFYKQVKEWEKIQSNNKRDRIKYFDEEDEYSSDLYDDYYAPFKRKSKNKFKKKEIQLLNEELIEDFGAYYEYIQKKNKAESNGIKQKEWSEFGHKMSVLSRYFNMKLNNKSNPIKHEYEIIGDKWWNTHSKRNNGEFNMKKLDIVLENKMTIIKLSNYDSSDDDYDEPSIDENEKELKYKINIVNGKIKKMENWDTNVMKRKEHLMTQLVNQTNTNATNPTNIKEIFMEEKKELIEEKHNDTENMNLNAVTELKSIENDNINTNIIEEETKEQSNELKRKSDNVNTNIQEEEIKEQVQQTRTQSKDRENDLIFVEVHGEKITVKQFWNEMRKLGQYVKKIWNLPAIKEIYKRRHNLFYFPCNMDYWFYNSTKIFHHNFVGTNQHLSLYRNYNTQIESFKFNDPHGPKVKLFDIPATTPQIRDKYWTREYCANCDAIIFTVSLVDIFNVSFEDPSQNAFYLSIQLFHEILHSKWLNKGCKIILFLTHRDLLIEYIRNGHSIKSLDTQFKKWNWRPKGYSNKSDIIIGKNDNNSKDKSEVINNRNENESDEKKMKAGEERNLSHLTDSRGDEREIDKTLNTIDAMHKAFDGLIESIEEKGNNNGELQNTLSMDNGMFVSRNSSLNKERDGTITKFIPELSEDIEVLSDDDIHIPQTHMEPMSHSTKEKDVKNLIVSQSDIMLDITKEDQEEEYRIGDEDRSNGDKVADIIPKNNDENTGEQVIRDENEEEEEKKVMVDIVDGDKIKDLSINEIKICKCPSGHELDKIVCDNSNYYLCDKCRCDLLEGMNQYQCRIDNYDLCEECHNNLLVMEKDKVKQELEKTPVWIIDEYKGIEYIDRLQTPKSDLERRLQKEKEKQMQEKAMRDITPDSKYNNVYKFNEEEEKRIEIKLNIGEEEEYVGRSSNILTQFKKQTRKRNKSNNDKNRKRNKKLELEHDENWKYILSGNKKLTYDGSTFDDERWVIETYDGYCEWIRDQFMKCKPLNDQRVIHCHILNLINQDDIGKVMYDLNNYVFRNVFHNDWMF